MAFDAIVTRAVTVELRQRLLLGKIEKVYQPESDELIFNIHTKDGNLRLFSSVSSQNPRVCLTDIKPDNPPSPLPFCMLLRKHLQGGRIVSVEQKGAERIIEISLETLNELGFTVSALQPSPDAPGVLGGLLLQDAQTGAVRSIPTDGLFVCIGQIPGNQPFAGVLELDGEGYIRAGEDCRTNVPGIFAAGDCRTKQVRQLTTAAADGAVAALAALAHIN